MTDTDTEGPYNLPSDAGTRKSSALIGAFTFSVTTLFKAS
jgi:hypothetical protein